MPDFHLPSQLPTPFNRGAVRIGTQKTIQIGVEDFANIRQNALISTFFRKEDLEELLSQTDCEGIRIYPAFADETERTFSMLAVGTTIGRNDIVSDDKETNKCFIAMGEDKALRIERKDAMAMMRRLNDHFFENRKDENVPFSLGENFLAIQNSYSKVFFSSGRMKNLLLDQNAIGIRFYSAQTSFDDSSSSFPTLVGVTVLDTGEEVSSATLSVLPCPPDCGGGSYTDDDSAPIS